MTDDAHKQPAASQRDDHAANKWLSLVYQELRRLAASKMASEAPGHTLQATALVHKVWLRLTNDEKRVWNDRNHFFASAAEAMRRILVNNARRKSWRWIWRRSSFARQPVFHPILAPA